MGNRTGLALAITLTVTLLLAGQPAQADVQRLAGPTRIETAIAISAATWPPGTASVAVLARADVAADALAATPLAAGRGPILLTTSTSLVPDVAAELDRALAPDATIYLAGGSTALHDEVEQDVVALGRRTIRLSGPTRYDTAVAVATATLEQLQVDGTPGGIVIATGGQDFTAALLAGVHAGRTNQAVVLTDDARLPATVEDFLDDQGLPVTAVGHDAVAAVGDRTTTTVVGADPSTLSVRMAEQLPVGTRAAVASSEQFPDALAGGAHAATHDLPLLLTRQATASPVVRDHLAAQDITDLVVYGGDAAIAPATVSELLGEGPPLATPTTAESARAATVPAGLCGLDGLPARFIDGTADRGDGGVAEFADGGVDAPAVTVVDVTGDGADDAIVRVFCTAGGVGWSDMFVVTDGDQSIGPAPLTELGVYIERLQWTGSTIQVEYGTPHPDEPDCCGTIHHVDQVVVDGVTLALVDARTVSTDSITAELLAAADRGDRATILSYGLEDYEADALITHAPWTTPNVCRGEEDGSRYCPIASDSFGTPYGIYFGFIDLGVWDIVLPEDH